MPNLREIVFSLYGTYRLARLDKGGVGYFDISVKGFWNSFFAAVIVAPFYGLLLYQRYAAGLEDAHPLRYVAIETIAYVILWVAFPLVMASMARILDRERQYMGYIIVYNWAQVLQNAVHLPLTYLGAAEAAPSDMVNALQLIVLTVLLGYTGFITVTVLEVAVMTAVGVVFLDFVMSVFINAIAFSII